MNTSRIVRISGLFLAAGLLAGCAKAKTEQTAPAAAGHGTPVAVETASRRSISESLVYTGTLEAGRKINITPETGGKVARILVEEGQRVAAGQLLAELDTENVRLQLRQAEAAVAVAEANLKNAARNAERMDRLLAEKAVSDQQTEQVRLAHEAAKAQLEQAQAAVNLARHALNTAVMKAPWAGLIGSKNAEVGDVINPMMGGFSPVSGVLTLIDDARIKIVVEVSQTDIGRIQRGQAAVVRVGNGAAKEVVGRVAVVNPTADALSKKFRIEVLADNAGRALRPGTFGSVVFKVQTHENALAIPQKAVFNDRYVFVARDGKAVRREVVLGLKNTDHVEIVEGLAEGETVIVEGGFGLADGSPVEIKK